MRSVAGLTCVKHHFGGSGSSRAVLSAVLAHFDNGTPIALKEYSIMRSEQQLLLESVSLYYMFTVLIPKVFLGD